jgi:hypothetical protein
LSIQHQVLSVRQARQFFTESAIRHRLRTGRWRRAHRGVLLASASGQLDRRQRWWVAVLGTPGTVLAGRSALEAAGLRGFAADTVDLLLRPGRRGRHPPDWARLHHTRNLPSEDLLAAGLLPCTAPARSLVDAARWASSDNEARTVIAMAFQQRLVEEREVLAALDRAPRGGRRKLIYCTVLDSARGAHALGELDFVALCRQAGFPEPRLQAARRDADGRQRYLDALFDGYGVGVEIEGSGHSEVGQAWADMRRQNALWVRGGRLLRFPSWVMREQPDQVIGQVGAALRAAGWRSDSRRRPSKAQS